MRGMAAWFRYKPVNVGIIEQSVRFLANASTTAMVYIFSKFKASFYTCEEKIFFTIFCP